MHSRRIGDYTTARQLFTPFIAQDSSIADEAFFALLEVCEICDDTSEMLQLLNRFPARRESVRGRFFLARLEARESAANGLISLINLAETDGLSAHLKSLILSDAIKLLDQLGRYREAVNLIDRCWSGHRVAGSHHLCQHLDGQLQRLQRGLPTPSDEAKPELPPTVLMAALPRTGSSLLEQMLGAHERVQPIGEFAGIGDAIRAMERVGLSPYKVVHLPQASRVSLRNKYLGPARSRTSTPDEWTLDKSLLIWHSLPFAAGLLPEAKIIHLQRDPRDTAISILLSWLDVSRFAWTTSLLDIYAVMERAARLLPLSLRAYQFQSVSVRYEDLVHQPASTINTCLSLLGLDPDPITLRPEKINRPGTTISYQQIRQPLSDRSIGRWRHYAWLFDAKWHKLAHTMGYS